jgi:DNA-binding response OmpR family regulator
MDRNALDTKAGILVVEDEALIRLWVADILEENGFSVLEAKDADAALKLLESRRDVKLLFTDVQMPGTLNGMELAREVHARWPHILLVITSGRERPTRAEIPDDGRFVAKPYSGEELLVQVNDLMHKSPISRS